MWPMHCMIFSRSVSRYKQRRFECVWHCNLNVCWHFGFICLTAICLARWFVKTGKLMHCTALAAIVKRKPQFISGSQALKYPVTCMRLLDTQISISSKMIFTAARSSKAIISSTNSVHRALFASLFCLYSMLFHFFASLLYLNW